MVHRPLSTPSPATCNECDLVVKIPNLQRSGASAALCTSQSPLSRGWWVREHIRSAGKEQISHRTALLNCESVSVIGNEPVTLQYDCTR